ncbi:MAG: hypothetical protein R3E79_26590 [Caldilineaceae bacterium]
MVLGGRKSEPAGRVSLRSGWWLRRRRRFHLDAPPAHALPRAIPTIGVAGNQVLALGGGEWEQ